jgi:modulator of FtsH protease HflK
MNQHPPTVEPFDRAMALDTPVDSGSQALSEALRSSFSVLKFLMVVLMLVFLLSGVFTVGPQERAIILRLGKPVGQGEQALLGPGLHLSFPYPIDSHEIVSITGLQKVDSTVGWYATTPEQELAGTEPPPGGSLNPAADGYALTADGNIIHTRASLTYRINDPVTYVFNFVNASNAIQDALNNALLYAASRYKVDDILTRDVIGFNEAVRRRVTELVENQRLGVVVEQCVARSIPPRQLKEAFDNVLKAEVTRSKVLNDARSYENQTLSKASADAGSRINSAHSDRVRVVNDIKSQAERFKDVLPRYRANPALFVQQRLVDTLGRVLTNVQDKILIPESVDGKSKEMRYHFNRELRVPGTNAPPR